MYMIYAVMFSITNNISMTMPLPDRYDSYLECAYWASSYQAAINDQEDDIQIRAWECRKS